MTGAPSVPKHSRVEITPELAQAGGRIIADRFDRAPFLAEEAAEI
jgi:hypothetical protein